MWKDNALTYINLLDQEYERYLLWKEKEKAKVLMVHFLTETPERPDAGDMVEEDAIKTRWEQINWDRARSGLQNLLDQALPNVFLSALPEAVSKMDPSEIWKLLEQSYGLGLGFRV